MLRALAITVLVASSALAQTPDVTGTWNVRLTAPDGPRDMTLTLTRNGEMLGGSIKGAEGESKVHGTQSGKDLSVAFTAAGGRADAITLKGSVNGNTISGPATFGQAAGKWSGTRAADAVSPVDASTLVNLTGTWAFEVTSPVGKGTPTVVFKQNGESLTGTYTGQMGEVPLQGTLKGEVLSFATEMTVGTMKLHVVYTGTASKDGLKGTIKYGAMGEGTFTARRK
ncbi:MAG: hypothetical protein ABIX28_14450 [Vicinamibacterales bacterium]